MSSIWIKPYPKGIDLLKEVTGSLALQRIGHLGVLIQTNQVRFLLVVLEGLSEL
jgi:hypothetical protein